jgi:hypothetical protein
MDMVSHHLKISKSSTIALLQRCDFNIKKCVGFKVLTMVLLKRQVFCDVMLC